MSKRISVKERLPKIDTPVLWFDGNNTLCKPASHHIDELNKNGCCVENYLHNYTHWMPLPEAPEVQHE